jgi:uncharacterized protein YcbX
MNVTVLQTTPITGTMLHQPDAVEIGPNGVETNRRFYLVDDRGRVVVAPAAVHQLHPELGLQLADRHREGRLGDVAGGGPAEMALLLERGQIFEPAEEHRR